METKNSVYVRTEVQHRPEKATLLEPEAGLWTRRLPWILSGSGALLLMVAGGLGVAAVRLVDQEQAVRNILLDIAKTRGLPEKLVPAVRGDLGLELIALVTAVVAGILIFAGLARAARLHMRSSRFTIGEDPSSSWVCSSRRLPDPCFALASIEDGQVCRFQVTDVMEGIVQVDDHQVHTLATYARTFGSPVSPLVRAFTMEDFREVRIEQDQQVWIFSRSGGPALRLPMQWSAGLFGASLVVALGLGLALAAYLNRLTDDPIFGDRVESQEITLRNLVKPPDLVAEKKKLLQDLQLKDQEKPKNLYEPTQVSEKTAKSAPRDPRRNDTPSSGGPSSRVSTPQGIGVANVLASSVSAMTASLTANNTVFGQETEDLSDLLGDFDGAGENPDGGFLPRGGPGGGPGGGLSIGGPPTTGWGGIFSDRSGPPSLNPLIGPHRREPILRDGKTEVSGKMDPNEVRAVIRAHRNEVHHCYQKGLLENDRAAGVVRVVFHLNPAGRAIECRIEENLSVSSVGNCICGRIQIWRFPQPEGGLAKISYAWTLQPGGL
ncbi:MAG: hypothetical protein CVU59_03585 [Deltaproteobacteria bacterium HGW-Deltaproteobacteria-17]|nr:MAG: hypothetical protein CVU59_03585 [Deltaproteobacteria bacterium HGW-Deltaproteobacteria-17]